MLELKDQNHTSSDCCQKTAETTPERKLPAWAIILAVTAFIIFNALFLVFAMQMGSGGNPG